MIRPNTNLYKANHNFFSTLLTPQLENFKHAIVNLACILKSKCCFTGCWIKSIIFDMSMHKSHPSKITSVVFFFFLLFSGFRNTNSARIPQHGARVPGCVIWNQQWFWGFFSLQHHWEYHFSLSPGKLEERLKASVFASVVDPYTCATRKNFMSLTLMLVLNSWTLLTKMIQLRVGQQVRWWDGKSIEPRAGEWGF